MTTINKRQIWVCILLSIITLGIYAIYWMYLLIKNVRILKQHDSSCTGEILCFFLVPFYSLYWWYTRGNDVKNLLEEREYRISSTGTLYLVLSIFGLGIVAAAIMQNDFNALPDTDASTQPHQQKARILLNKNLTNTQKLAFGGMLAALVFAATYLFKIPISITQGYIHLGDAFILLGAVLLDWTAVPAAAIGSLLADLIAGYPLYCLPTFLIKAGVAAIAVAGCRKTQSDWVRILWFVLAELWMVLGYFLVEWLPLGYGLAAALGAVGPNLVQGLSGVVIAAVLQPVVRRIRKQK